MDAKTCKTIVLVIAILGIVFSGLGILSSLALLGLGGLLGAELPGLQAGIFGGLAAGMAVVGLLISLFTLYVYLMVLKYKNWARIAAIILAVISLLSFPFGTIFGAAVIYFFGFNKDMKKLFK